MKYELLPMDEWGKLSTIYPPERPLPSPVTASVAVAKEEEDVVGALFLQIALHMEPLLISSPVVNYMKLVSTLEKNLPEGTTYYAFAPDAKIGRMAEIAGMTEVVGWRVYKKEV